MSTQTAQSPVQGSRQRTRSCATGLRLPPLRAPATRSSRPCSPARTAARGSTSSTTTSWPRSHFSDVPSSERPQNIWHFEELLPIVDASAQARVGRHSGYTPLIRADRLGAELGLSNLYLKDDSSNRPSLSYKDRVVSMSVARLLELGKTEIGCVSTGNVGTAVASLAAKAGVDAYVFYPNRLEDTKARACMALGAKVCQVEGNYDEANRRCRELAETTGMDFANITLRPVLRGGRKDGGIRDRRAARLAGARPHHHGGRRRHAVLAPAQGPGRAAAAGARPRRTPRASTSPSPAAATRSRRAILAEEAEIHPVTPETAAHSLAIGAPGDGYLVIDAVLKRGGTGGFAQRPGDLRRHRPARRDRGPADRAGGRHHDRRRSRSSRPPDASPGRHRRGDHHRQRPEDARRPPAEAVAGQGRLRARRDAGGARASSRAAARSWRARASSCTSSASAAE